MQEEINKFYLSVFVKMDASEPLNIERLVETYKKAKEKNSMYKKAKEKNSMYKIISRLKFW